MPAYDPKSKRPKLVPVAEDAPVDKLLADTAPLEPERTQLSVVPPVSDAADAAIDELIDDAGGEPSTVAVPSASTSGTGPRPALVEPSASSSKLKLGLAVAAVVGIVAAAIVVVERRR